MADEKDVSLTKGDKDTAASKTDHQHSTEPGPGNLSGSDGGHGGNNQIRVGSDGEETPDPFDLTKVRLSQDFESSLGVKRVLMTVPVRKPLNESFVQVHPSEEYRVNTYLIELKDEREIYWVAPGLWSQLGSEPTFSPRALFTAITRQGDLFLWPIRLPRVDGRIDSFNRSAMEAAQRAQGRWVRVAANMGLKSYDVWEAPATLAPPVWPATPFQDLLRIAFKDKLIETPDHLVLQKLRGEA